MSVGAPSVGEDWTTPATKADLKLLKADVKLLDSDLRVEMARMDRNLRDVVTTQGDELKDRIAKQGDDLKDRIADIKEEIARLRVSMAWMTMAVVMGLGGLITLFQFLSWGHLGGEVGEWSPNRPGPVPSGRPSAAALPLSWRRGSFPIRSSPRHRRSSLGQLRRPVPRRRPGVFRPGSVPRPQTT